MGLACLLVVLLLQCRSILCLHLVNVLSLKLSQIYSDTKAKADRLSHQQGLEYTECKGASPSLDKDYLGYNTKLHLSFRDLECVGVSFYCHYFQVNSTSGVVVPVRISSRDQIHLFKNESYLIGSCAKKAYYEITTQKMLI